jgi:hypothetical protein
MGVVVFVVGIVLVTFGALVIVGPWLTIVERAIRRNSERVSFVPFVGSVFCAVGFALIDAPGWLYLVLVLDVGTTGLLIGLIISWRSRSPSS